jgi:hypothetical protein
MYIGLYLNTRYFYHILIKIIFSGQVFEIYSNIKFHENLSSRNRVVSRGQTDITKLIVAFHNLENPPNKTGYTAKMAAKRKEVNT